MNRKESIVQDRIAGLSKEELATKYGVSPHTIRNVLAKAISRGLATHQQLRMREKRRRNPPTLQQKIMAKIASIHARIKITAGGCWEWQKFRNAAGYGWTSWLGRNRPVHRVVYELLNGPVDDKLVICHQCDNPPCCNPAHLWVGTEKQNMQDAAAKRRWSRQHQTHCKRGHEFSPDNTRIKIQRGKPCRVCRACEREKNRLDHLSGRALARQRRRRERLRAASQETLQV